MPDPLKGLSNAVAADRGLQNNITDRQLAKGVKAAEDMNDLLMRAIARSGVNQDGLLSGKDMARVSAEVYDRPAQYVAFLEAHGNDNGDVVSGFHYVQGDGGTLVFQGRDFIDTIADSIYHYGFRVIDGRYVNEDGAANETAADVAGWLNYFLNGENVVWGNGTDETLGSGDYSGRFADAANETFYAGKGDDRIWAGEGDDKVFGEDGNDTSGGGLGRDRMYGGAGADTLYGDEDNDRLWGGLGADTLGGSQGADRLYGGNGNDHLNGGQGRDMLMGGKGQDRLDGSDGNDNMDGGDDADLLYGGAGSDRMAGGKGNDDMHGSDGNDRMRGGAGRDELSGGAGKDRLDGGTGADTYQLWEERQVTDTIVIRPGDSGRTAGKMDYVEGFDADHDLIDLSAFAGMSFKALDHGGGGGSAYFDGTFLRLDIDGDRATDMMIEFRHVGDLSQDNFIF